MTAPMWNDISTAPKDGTWFLALMDRERLGCAVWPMRMGKAPMVGTSFAFDFGAEPTHWMPFPPPPERT